MRDPSKFPTLDFEDNLWKTGFTHIAGIDEAGRGAWAGPVCAAAVILPMDPSLTNTLERVRDSKLMTRLARETWAPRIRQISLAWGVGFASPREIDGLGILRATKLAAMRALATMSSPNSTLPNPRVAEARLPEPLLEGYLAPDYLLTDYLIFPNIELPQTALVKGDRLSLSIAAASVLAKTARDARMRELDDSYPAYGFACHKGYGTSLHQTAIRRIGLCEIHRKSFSIMQ